MTVITDTRVGHAFGLTATSIGATVLNCVFVHIIKTLATGGVEPPIFKSGNLPGADG